MTIKEACERRIPRITRPEWGDTGAYVRLPLFGPEPPWKGANGGGYGPWAELYDDRTQQEVLGIRPGSQRFCTLLDWAETDGWEPYTGPVSEFEKHPDNYSKVYVEE